MADTSVDFGNERSNAELADALARAALGEDSDDLDNDVFDFSRLAGYVLLFQRAPLRTSISFRTLLRFWRLFTRSRKVFRIKFVFERWTWE